MFRGFTLWLTVFAAAMDLFSLSGYDPDHIFLHMFNPVSWLLHIFNGVPFSVRMALNYVTNIAFWFLVGRYVDHFIAQRERRRAS